MGKTERWKDYPFIFPLSLKDTGKQAWIYLLIICTIPSHNVPDYGMKGHLWKTFKFIA